MDKLFLIKKGKNSGILLNPFNMYQAVIIDEDTVTQVNLNKDDLNTNLFLNDKPVTLLKLAQTIRRGNLYTIFTYNGNRIKLVDALRDKEINQIQLIIDDCKLYIKSSPNSDIKNVRKLLTLGNFMDIMLYETDKELTDKLKEFMNIYRE